MMMGPEPMIRIFEMSVRLGICQRIVCDNNEPLRSFRTRLNFDDVLVSLGASKIILTDQSATCTSIFPHFATNRYCPGDSFRRSKFPFGSTRTLPRGSA